MTDEIVYRGDPVRETGLTLTANVFTQAGIQFGGTITMTETDPGVNAIYNGDFPLATGAGIYIVRILDGATMLGDDDYAWDGLNEVHDDYMRSLIANRIDTDPVTGEQRIYANDDVTVLVDGAAWKNTAGTLQYDGTTGIDRRDRMTP